VAQAAAQRRAALLVGDGDRRAPRVGAVAPLRQDVGGDRDDAGRPASSRSRSSFRSWAGIACAVWLLMPSRLGTGRAVDRRYPDIAFGPAHVEGWRNLHISRR
jgi:hypothetical protein